jgi:hypothetical protein
MLVRPKICSATIGAVAVRVLVDQYPAGYDYSSLTAVAVVALLVPNRNLLRPWD